MYQRTKRKKEKKKKACRPKINWFGPNITYYLPENQLLLPEYYLFSPNMATWKILGGGGGAAPASYAYECTHETLLPLSLRWLSSQVINLDDIKSRGRSFHTDNYNIDRYTLNTKFVTH